MTAAGLCSWYSQAALAQVVPPRALETPQPEQPKNRVGMPLEGWAIVRFTVLANGKATDARVIDKMPLVVPDRDVRNAVEDWTFEPATADGEPIDWFNNEAVIVFDSEGVPPEPTPAFMGAYNAADELLHNNEPEDALRSNERMLTTATRLRELGLAHVQNAAINIALGDHHAAYAAILRATDPRIRVLGYEELPIALQYRNLLELQLGNAQAAIETFARRNEITAVTADDAMGSRIQTIEQALAAEDSVIAITGKVIDEQWRHTPTRRTFAIGDVDGSVETIHVECDRRTADLEYTPDAEWTLPGSWGACTLTVQGRRDTSFRFYEFR